MQEVEVPLEAIIQKLAVKLSNSEIRIASLESYIDRLQHEIMNAVPVQENPNPVPEPFSDLEEKITDE